MLHFGEATMTVYSINKRVLEQASLISSSERTAASNVEAGFANLLQSTASRFSGIGEPGAAAALADSINKPAAEIREPERVEKPTRPENKPNDRHARRAEKPAEKPVRAERDQAAETERAEVKSAEPTDKVDVAADAGAEPETTTDASAGQTRNDAADDGQPQAVAAPVDGSVQKQVMTGQLAEAIIEIDGTEGGEIVLAGAKTDQNGQNAAGEDQAEAGPAEGEIDPALELLAQTAAKAKAGKAEEEIEGEAVEIAYADDLAGEQARSLADKLADTNARIQVKVEVSEAPVEQTVTLDGFELGAQTASNGGGNASQAKGQGVANAAAQVAQNPALDNAQAAAGKAVDAKPFAAILAAQVEGAQQPSSVQSGQGSANAGLAGVGGTQAAQKAQAANAPQAPQAPRHVPPQQVIDQVAVQIDKQVKDGADHIKIQLKPHDLGKIEIKLEVAQDGRVTGVVTADSKDTLAILQKDAKGLEKALQDAGLKAESGALSFNLRGEQQRNAESNGAEGQQGRRRGRVKTGIDATSEASALAAKTAMRGSGRQTGVDIQV